MATPTAAAPDAVLDDILALGGDPVEEYESEGESESPDSEEFAAPEEGEAEEESLAPEEDGLEPGEEEAPLEEEEGAEETPESEPVADGQDRIRALAAEAKRAQRFRPILEILEENPDIAREIVGRKLGLVPADRQQVPQQVAPQQPQRPQMSAQELDAYWNKKLQESPAAALAEMLDLKLQGIRAAQAAQAEPVATASFNSVVRSFKTDLRDPNSEGHDEQWQYYEPYFDALLKTADKNYVMSDPDTTLAALKDLAYGRWASDQKKRRAKALREAPPARRRENPRTRLATPTSGRSGVRVKQTRALTKEEAMLAERYGLDLVTPDEDEPESAWR